MKKKFHVLIMGDGRMGQAVAYYLKKFRLCETVSFHPPRPDKHRFDLVVGALPGPVGEQSLACALKHRVPLVDIADIDPPFYRHRRKEILQGSLLVIPECGFSPGLINLIIGQAYHTCPSIKKIEVSAGSLTTVPNTFPFLWCFEDLMGEHRLPSWQLVKGQKVKYPPFGEYRQEKFFGLPAESYYCASGFEQLLDRPGLRDLTTRVVRPLGYKAFYEALRSHGFLTAEHYLTTKQILEGHKADNITFTKIKILTKKEKIVWTVKSSATKRERWNSMQKITASLPVILADCILKGRLEEKGLVFVEALGQSDDLFRSILRAVRRFGIEIYSERSAA